jgi:hypothetical protein
MRRSIHRGGLAMSALLIALGSGTALALPAQAASSWSTPVALPGSCGQSVAVNAAGAEVAAGYRQNADGTITVQVCTSPDGQNWSAPVTLGQGVSPAVAISPDGRAVAVWEGGPGTAATVQASVRPPGGQWSPPVLLSADYGHPVVGMDGSGNAIAAWAAFSGPIETVSLPVGGTWTPVTTLATRGQAVDLAVNKSGAAVMSWGSRTATMAAYGTVLGGFAAPVAVGPPPPYPVGHTSAALNDTGAAALAWSNGTSDFVVTRPPGGTWSNPTTLSTTASGPVDVAVNGTGDTIVVFGQEHISGSSITIRLYTSQRQAGGTWQAAVPLSAAGDTSPSARIAADAAGTFVLAWGDSTAQTLSVITSPPGGGFGPPATFGAPAINDLALAAGHAVLSFRPAPSSPVEIVGEPVS